MARVVYFVKDLLFSSKIREVASQLGVEVEPVRDPKALPAAAARAKLVILDLRLPNVLEAADALAADPVASTVPSVGFIDHEKIELMDEAQRHGVKKVMARGRFTTELPVMLSELVDER